MITGGSRGIGAALAREFAGAGARVTVLAGTPRRLNELIQSGIRQRDTA